MLVEAFAGTDSVQGFGGRDVFALSTNAFIDIGSLLGKPGELQVSLANGTRATFGGDISQAAMLGSEGGMARYRLRLSPWIWRLGQVRNSRVWEDKSVIDIVNAVFEAYRPLARWRWSDETGPFMSVVPARSYCCQYRESDLDLVRRLLTEEGLSWRFEQGEDGAGLVLFADSTQASAVPDDASSGADGAVRFHNARTGERQDTVQALRAQRSISASLTTVLSYDYKAKKTVSANSPSRPQNGRNVGPLESFDVPGQYAYASAHLARHYADLQTQGREARSQLWQGRSTLRTLRAGTRLTLRDTPLQSLGEAPVFAVLSVTCVGINNLPSPAQHALAELFGPIPELLEELMREDTPDAFALVVAQARKSGYANCFEAVRANVPWRPQLPDSAGRHRARATAPGSQSAIVVGPDGRDTASGADELYCDCHGRVRIRFHWQDSDASCWVRVAQRSAGGGMGSQFLPRIGQEVVCQFSEGNIDRPTIIGALYNGQGEGGVTSTPGGQAPSATSFTLLQISKNRMNKLSKAMFFALVSIWLLGASSDALAGYKTLTVAVFDFAGGVGKASFKAMRTNGARHRCWGESFGEIAGIETAYIENVPASPDPADFQRALKGDAVSAERFRKSIRAAGLNGAYAFTLDVSGTYVVVHGIGSDSNAISSSASVQVAPKELITPLQLPKELCPASKSMD